MGKLDGRFVFVSTLRGVVARSWCCCYFCCCRYYYCSSLGRFYFEEGMPLPRLWLEAQHRFPGGVRRCHLLVLRPSLRRRDSCCCWCCLLLNLNPRRFRLPANLCSSMHHYQHASLSACIITSMHRHQHASSVCITAWTNQQDSRREGLVMPGAHGSCTIGQKKSHLQYIQNVKNCQFTVDTAFTPANVPQSTDALSKTRVNAGRKAEMLFYREPVFSVGRCNSSSAR